ncbi:MAG: CBS domain-containing protein [Oligoflexia bacterium]|nr:CBS domain-containing protein [Oligoflexia bacterium]
MSEIPPISDFMAPHPYTIDLLETASTAEKVMNMHHVRHLPVVDGSAVVGILSDRDIGLARRLYKEHFDGTVLVKDICLFESFTATESTPITEVAKVMSDRRLEAVVVVRAHTPVGIFTTIDACRALATCWKDFAKGHRGFLSRLFG